ncbi:MAG: hypothetical protein MJ252_07015 [archaeon]|nr:hypothetical protein [archaeon]
MELTDKRVELKEDDVANDHWYFWNQPSEDNACCPICENIIQSPVKCNKCQQNFCMNCLQKEHKTKKKGKKKGKCPHTYYHKNYQLLNEFLQKLKFICRDCGQEYDYTTADNHQLVCTKEWPKNLKKRKPSKSVEEFKKKLQEQRREKKKMEEEGNEEEKKEFNLEEEEKENEKEEEEKKEKEIPKKKTEKKKKKQEGAENEKNKERKEEAEVIEVPSSHEEEVQIVSVEKDKEESSTAKDKLIDSLKKENIKIKESNEKMQNDMNAIKDVLGMSTQQAEIMSLRKLVSGCLNSVTELNSKKEEMEKQYEDNLKDKVDRKEVERKEKELSEKYQKEIEEIKEKYQRENEMNEIRMGILNGKIKGYEQKLKSLQNQRDILKKDKEVVEQLKDAAVNEFNTFNDEVGNHLNDISKTNKTAFEESKQKINNTQEEKIPKTEAVKVISDFEKKIDSSLKVFQSFVENRFKNTFSSSDSDPKEEPEEETKLLGKKRKKDIFLIK